MKQPITISLSPNAEGKDILHAFRLLVSPWRYTRGESVKLLEQWFRKYFDVPFAVSFNSGRSSLFAILKSLDIAAGDEVVLQAFTCVAVPNAVLWAGGTPVYVDIVDNMTMDTKDLERKITSKTKAIIVQHTFGIPTDMDEVGRIARKNNLFIIEDCAHSIGSTYKRKKLGTLGDAAFFSFGRDKAFSSVFGGMVITNDKILGGKIRNFQKLRSNPRFFWVMQQLLHPIAFSIILPLYDTMFIGKSILVILQKLHLLSFPVSVGEKKSDKKAIDVRKFPNALASLALLQLKRITEFNKKREQIALMYISQLRDTAYTLPAQENIPYLRFPILTAKKENLLAFMRKNGVYLGNWYSFGIDPRGVDFSKISYDSTTCPRTNEVIEKVVNLPTYPKMTMSDVQNVIRLLQAYATTSRD